MRIPLNPEAAHRRDRVHAQLAACPACWAWSSKLRLPLRHPAVRRAVVQGSAEHLLRDHDPESRVWDDPSPA